MQRFLPSEFGNDIDRSRAVDPINQNFQLKVQLRRAIEASGIPYTFIVSNIFSGYALTNLLQLGATSPPRDKLVIPGDGNVKGILTPLLVTDL